MRLDINLTSWLRIGFGFRKISFSSDKQVDFKSLTVFRIFTADKTVD